MSNGTDVTLDARLSDRTGWLAGLVFGSALALGVAYVGAHLIVDLAQVRSPSVLPYLLLGLALFVALGFEFAGALHVSQQIVLLDRD